MKSIRHVGYTFLLLSTVVKAQELSLFEPTESTGADERPGVAQNIINQNGQPAYSLRSMVRVGDKISLTLVDRAGKQTAVTWQQGQKATVPGAIGFTVEDIQQRTVVLSQPGNDPCLNSPKLGVSCVNALQSKLAMTTAAPVVPKAQANPLPAAGQNTGIVPPQNPFEAAIQAQQQAQAAQGIPVPVPGNQAVFVNPFNGRQEVVDQGTPEQQAARDQRQRARADRLNRFDQERIPDTQVPQGMRRVTTPFGDRVVPVRE